MSVNTAAVLAWLAEHSLRVTALMLVVGLGSLLVRRASAHGRLFAWTVVLSVAVCMPVLAVLLPEVPVISAFADPVIVVNSPGQVVDEPIASVRAALPGGIVFSPLSWLLAVYLAGAAFLVLRLAAGTHLTSRVQRRAHEVDDPVLSAEVRTLATAMRLPVAPRVVHHSSVHVPFVCGLRHPVVVLPDEWRTWDAATLRAVLTHELSHIARRDLWTLRAAAVYRALTWFSPVSWWLRRNLETLAERASDDAVLASGVEPTAYAEMLVRFFDAAQRAPGRVSWRLAMARRGGVEARKRVGRVLSAREGGNVRFGSAGRVLVGVGVLVAAVPVIMLAAKAPETVILQQPAQQEPQRVDVKVKVEDRDTKAVTVTLKPSPQEPKQATVVLKNARMEPAQTVDIALNGDKPKTVDIKLTKAEIVDVVTSQEQEEEPWRSTKRATDPDVVAPKMTTSVHPKYTPDAMRAKIQGSVEVEVIVSSGGIVSNARVIKSLDSQFGLDGEALKAVSQWTFIPGTYQGEPIAVRARITMEFRLH